MLYRRRWAAITAFLVVALATAAYAYTRVPMYRASARLLLLSERESFGLKEANAFEPPNHQQTQYVLLGSRWVAKRAMEDLGLLTRPPLDPSRQQASDTSPTSATASLMQEAPHETPAITRFLSGLRVAAVSGSGLVDVIYSSTNPAICAERANAIAAAYVKQTIELKARASKEASGWLAELLADQHQKVQDAENALQRYRETHNVVAVDERSNPILQTLADLSVAATRARTARIEKETTYRRLRALQDNPAALQSSPAVFSDPAVQQLKAEVTTLERRLIELSGKLGERHPDLIKTQDALRAAQARLQAQALRTIDLAAADLQAAQAVESSAVGVFNAQRQQALNADSGGVQAAVLLRDVDSNRQIYENLTRQARELDISGEIRMNTALILESARTPGSPVSPNVVGTAQNGLLGGLFIGIALAFLIEYLDSRLKSPDEVKNHLGLPMLGFVPVVSAKALRGKDPSAEIASGSEAFTEAFRTVRTNLIFSSPQPGTQIVVVTSTNPAEGKTVVATNLSIALAQAGQRILLIDGDLRRPRAHEIFGLKQEPGLSNMLVGTCQPAAAIHASRVPNLRIMPAGRVPPNPSELLGSRRFKEFLQALREHFDWVVIDSPPVMVTSDAAIIAHQADGAVFVVSASATSRHAARAALEQLQSANATVLGAVLNKMDIARHGYYYSKYYRRDYAKYYVKAN